MRPSRIYKYESFSAQALQNLKSQIIYFGSPRGFNDPYDCALSPAIEVPTDLEVEAVRSIYTQRQDLPETGKQTFRSMPVEVLRDMLVKTATDTVKKFAEDFLNKNGVSCFSETPDNLLMWSHYAGKSQGFCLEYDTTFEPFNRLMKVTYSKTIPPVKITADLISPENQTSIAEKLYCTKSEDWSYEREWRIIHTDKNTRYVYPTDSLTGVYFGPESTGPSQEIICLILQGQNAKVRFYQGERSPTEFKVTFREFTYTPHLEAKRRGFSP